MATDRVVTLVGADGSRNTLMCDEAEPYDLATDSQLWGIAPYDLASEPVANIPGERLGAVTARPRTFAVPIVLNGSTETEVDERIAELGSILSPRRDVTLIYQRADGTTREISARYLSGANALNVNRTQQRHVKAPLVFRAFWPYWRSTTSAIEEWGPSPFDDGRAAGSNNIEVVNSGDVVTWPEITITGHAEAIEFLSLNTGQVFRILEIIEVGSTLRIDTDPRTFGIYIDDVFAQTVVDPISEFFPLVPGPNRLIIRGNSNGTDPIGDFVVRWREQFETC